MAVTPGRPDLVERPDRAPAAQDARQGRNVRGMVTVLVVSLVLIVVAYGVIVALFGGAPDSSPNADLSSESGATASPGPAPPPSQAPQ